MKRLLFVALILQMFLALNVYGAILDVRNGILFGAADVDVNGVLYDVAFLDGTAIDLYNGADDSTDFPFYNPSDPYNTTLAYMAGEALLNQVFIGIFDTSPSLINGIGAPGGGDFLIPTRLQSSNQIGIIDARNYSNENSDAVISGYGFITTDTSAPIQGPQYDHTAYAVWSLATPVPIPGAFWLLGSGLLGILGLRKKPKGRGKNVLSQLA